MKKLGFYLILTCFLWACNTSEKEAATDGEDTTGIVETPAEKIGAQDEIEVADNTSEKTDDKEDIGVSDEIEVDLEGRHLKEKEDVSELKYLKTFIPEDHVVMDYEYGDLNRDDKKDDVILVSYSKTEAEEGGSIGRTTYILTRQTDGKLKKEGENGSVVLCSDCGGVMGDPYQGIVIKNGYFSLEHWGGSRWKWTQINTFKYDGEKKGWYLHKKGGESYDSFEPEKVEETVSTVKDFGIIAFDDYTDE